MTKPTTQQKKIPLRALQFAADVEMQADGKGGNVPLAIKARSGKPVTHWWWAAPIIHDLSGFTSKPAIPLDYCHDPCDVIGFANAFDVASGDLVVSGALTPFAEKDRASEVIHKHAQGVPYEASIFFDPFAMTIEEVPAGVTVRVNGADYIGPLNVVRQWTLRGVAVCPYGTDSQTAVEFGSHPAAAQEAAVTVFSKDHGMTKATLSGKPAGKTAFEDAPAEDAPKAEGEQPAAEDCPCKGQDGCDCDQEETAEMADEEQPSDDAGKQSAAPGPGAKFLTAFGDMGGRWFAEGKSFEEAQTLFTQHLQGENARLSKENGELRGKLKLARGETKPVGFSAPPAAEEIEEKAAAEMARKTGSAGIGKFAAGLKLPGQKS